MSVTWPMDLRPLTTADIADVHRLEADCYLPALHESPEALIRLVEVFPHGAVGAFDRARLCGYVFGLPLRSGELLELQRPLARVPADADVFYIHDLAVAASDRGRGLGSRLARAIVEIGTASGFEAFELVSVQDSAPFWSRFGFRAVERILYGGAAAIRMRAGASSAV